MAPKGFSWRAKSGLLNEQLTLPLSALDGQAGVCLLVSPISTSSLTKSGLSIETTAENISEAEIRGTSSAFQRRGAVVESRL